jgi:hypothetical protein
VKIHQNFVDFHKILLKITKIRMDFQLTNFFGEFYMIFSLSVAQTSRFQIFPLPAIYVGNFNSHNQLGVYNDADGNRLQEWMIL